MAHIEFIAFGFDIFKEGKSSFDLSESEVEWALGFAGLNIFVCSADHGAFITLFNDIFRKGVVFGGKSGKYIVRRVFDGKIISLINVGEPIGGI